MRVLPRERRAARASSSSASRSTARSTSASAPANHGLYQPHGAAPGNDSPTYHDLVDTGLADANLTPIGPTAATGNGAGINGYTRYFNLLAGAPWLYNPTVNGGTFISYVDPPPSRLRIALVQALGLRGAWAWEITNDDNANDLVNAMSHWAT